MAGTRWVRLDVDYFSNPKAIRAGRDGRALHLASVCWSAAYLTDGEIPREVVPRLVVESGASRSAIDRLVEVGLWIPVEDVFLVHDYLAHNDSRSKVEHDRKLYRERQERWKRRKGDASSDASDDALGDGDDTTRHDT